MHILIKFVSGIENGGAIRKHVEIQNTCKMYVFLYPLIYAWKRMKMHAHTHAHTHTHILTPRDMHTTLSIIEKDKHAHIDKYTVNCTFTLPNAALCYIL